MQKTPCFPGKLPTASSMNKVLITGIFVAAVAVLSGSCHSSKKTSSKIGKKGAVTRIDTTGTASTTEASDLALACRLNQQAVSFPDFKTFSGKAKAKLDREGESHEFSANIRVRKGEAIWINVSALGGLVNVARLYITPDSVRMINFLQKNARLIPVSEVGNLLPFPVSFGDLQALLLGYAPGAAALQPRRMEANPAQLMVFNTSEPGEQIHFFSLPDSVLTGYSILRTAGGQTASLSMLLRQLTAEGGFRFHRERTVSWNDAGKEGSLQLHFDAPQWNTNISMPFSVPKGYAVD